MEEKYSPKEIIEFIKGMKSDDRALRLTSLAKMPVIAQALGPERTRDELIPYAIDITNHSLSDLAKIAEILGTMLNFVGGPQQANSLLQTLRFLCENEDMFVRDPATESLFRIGQALNDKEFRNMAQMIFGMCEDGWYPLKCSGIQLLCQLYSKIPNDMLSNAHEILLSLAGDPTVLVRRSLAKSLPELINQAKALSALDVIKNVLTTLSDDESSAVAIEVPISISLVAENDPDLGLSCSIKLFGTSSWQAKAVLISYIDKIFAKNFSKKEVLSFLKKVANETTTDQSSVVRTAIARQMVFLSKTKCMSNDEFNQFLQNLVADSETCVRTAVATEIGLLPKNATKSDVEDTVINTLLSDEEVEVRMEALKSIAVSGKAIKHISSNLSDLLSINNWRVRNSIVKLLPQMSQVLDEKKFDQIVFPVLKSLISDEASDVRHETVTQLPSLVKKYGKKWETSKIYPLIKELSSSPDYQNRKTAIEAVLILNAQDQLSNVLESACNDPVPNVRLVLAKNLPRNSKLLSKLKNDADKDVSEYASKQ